VIRRWGGLLKIFTTDGTDLQMGEKGWGRKTLRGGGGWICERGRCKEFGSAARLGE
jgi:hypothetical protein